MNYSTAVMLINKSIRAVKGQYDPEVQGSKSVTIFKTLLQDLKIDDFVVVESGTRHGITTVKIIEVDTVVDFDSSAEIKWVVGKIDMDAHKKIIEMEKAAIDVIKKGEMRKRREGIYKNIVDAEAAGEIDKLDIAKLTGSPVAIEGSK